MPATNIKIEKLLKDEFGITPVSAPALYLGLSTSVVGKDSTLSTITEVSGTGYSRKTIVAGGTGWSYVSGENGGQVVNAQNIEFTAGSNWGTVMSIFLCTVSTGTAGEIHYYYTLNPSIPVLSGTTITFAEGTLVSRRS